MVTGKINFLRSELLPLLRLIPYDRQPLWGRMTLHQMIEHFSYSVRVASGKLLFKEVLTPENSLSKFREFMLSDQPFRENTPNPLLPDLPAPVKNPSLNIALDELDKEFIFFFQYFKDHQNATTRNPIFGDLNFEQNVHLLHKHARHHLKQFGAVPEVKP